MKDSKLVSDLIRDHPLNSVTNVAKQTISIRWNRVEGLAKRSIVYLETKIVLLGVDVITDERLNRRNRISEVGFLGFLVYETSIFLEKRTEILINVNGNQDRFFSVVLENSFSRIVGDHRSDVSSIDRTSIVINRKIFRGISVIDRIAKISRNTRKTVNLGDLENTRTGNGIRINTVNNPTICSAIKRELKNLNVDVNFPSSSEI